MNEAKGFGAIFTRWAVFIVALSVPAIQFKAATAGVARAVHRLAGCSSGAPTVAIPCVSDSLMSASM